MRSWIFLLAGLIVWAVHFFALYFIASVFLTTPLARSLALFVTFGCLTAVALLLFRVLCSDTPTPMDIWMRTVALCGIGLSAVAIIWQALPVLFV